MESRSALLRQSVIRAMADDYENLEQVVGWATRSLSEQGLQASWEELIEVLRQVIDDGLARAYILSPEPPYSTPVPFTLADSGNLWFYLTAEGIDAVKRIASL